MLRFKDQTLVDLLSKIFYVFECSQCEAIDVEETTRHLHTRVADETQMPLSQPQISRIRDDAEETNHELVFNNFSILSRCNVFVTKITKTVLIHKMRPSLIYRKLWRKFKTAPLPKISYRRFV